MSVAAKAKSQDSMLKNHNIFFLCLALPLVSVILASNQADPDLFARVAMGRLIDNLGYVPLVDPFAWTIKKAAWIDHEWLSGYIFYLAANQFGDSGLIALKLFFALATTYILLRPAFIYCKPDTVPFAWAFLCIIDSTWLWKSTVRAQVFTYLFLAIFLLAFVCYERGGRLRLLLLLPLVMLVWCNAHGGFVVGLGLHLIFTAVALLRRERMAAWCLISFTLCIAATAFNPYGFSTYWSFMLDALSMPRASISEWHPLNPFSVKALGTNLIVALMLLSFTLKPRLLSITSILFLLSATFFAYRSERLGAILSMVALVYLTPSILAMIRSLATRSPRISLSLSRATPAAVMLLCFFSLYSVLTAPFSLNYSAYPVSALSWLEQSGAKGKLLNDFNVGSFALWRLYPKFKISLDGRYEETYPESTVKVVSQALEPDSPKHKELLADLTPDFILISSEQKVAEKWTASVPEWRSIYHDDKFRILCRENCPNQGLQGEVMRLRPIWKSLF